MRKLLAIPLKKTVALLLILSLAATSYPSPSAGFPIQSYRASRIAHYVSNEIISSQALTAWMEISDPLAGAVGQGLRRLLASLHRAAEMRRFFLDNARGIVAASVIVAGVGYWVPELDESPYLWMAGVVILGLVLRMLAAPHGRDEGSRRLERTPAQQTLARRTGISPALLEQLRVRIHDAVGARAEQDGLERMRMPELEFMAGPPRLMIPSSKWKARLQTWQKRAPLAWWFIRYDAPRLLAAVGVLLLFITGLQDRGEMTRYPPSSPSAIVEQRRSARDTYKPGDIRNQADTAQDVKEISADYHPAATTQHESETHDQGSGIVDAVKARLSGAFGTEMYADGFLNAMGEGGRMVLDGDMVLASNGKPTGEKTGLQIQLSAMRKGQTGRVHIPLNGQVASVSTSQPVRLSADGRIEALEDVPGGALAYQVERYASNNAPRASQPVTPWMSREFASIPPMVRAELDAVGKIASPKARLDAVARMLHRYFSYSNTSTVRLPRGMTWGAYFQSLISEYGSIQADCDVLSTTAFLWLRYLGVETVFVLGEMNGDGNNKLSQSEAHATLLVKMNSQWFWYETTASVEMHPSTRMGNAPRGDDVHGQLKHAPQSANPDIGDRTKGPAAEAAARDQEKARRDSGAAGQRASRTPDKKLNLQSWKQTNARSTKAAVQHLEVTDWFAVRTTPGQSLEALIDSHINNHDLFTRGYGGPGSFFKNQVMQDNGIKDEKNLPEVIWMRPAKVTIDDWIVGKDPGYFYVAEAAAKKLYEAYHMVIPEARKEMLQDWGVEAPRIRKKINELRQAAPMRQRPSRESESNQTHRDEEHGAPASLAYWIVLAVTGNVKKATQWGQRWASGHPIERILGVVGGFSAMLWAPGLWWVAVLFWEFHVIVQLVIALGLTRAPRQYGRQALRPAALLPQFAILASYGLPAFLAKTTDLPLEAAVPVLGLELAAAVFLLIVSHLHRRHDESLFARTSRSSEAARTEGAEAPASAARRPAGETTGSDKEYRNSLVRDMELDVEIEEANQISRQAIALIRRLSKAGVMPAPSILVHTAHAPLVPSLEDVVKILEDIDTSVVTFDDPFIPAYDNPTVEHLLREAQRIRVIHVHELDVEEWGELRGAGDRAAVRAMTRWVERTFPMIDSLLQVPRLQSNPDPGWIESFRGSHSVVESYIRAGQIQRARLLLDSLAAQIQAMSDLPASTLLPWRSALRTAQDRQKELDDQLSDPVATSMPMLIPENPEGARRLAQWLRSIDEIQVDENALYPSIPLYVDESDPNRKISMRPEQNLLRGDFSWDFELDFRFFGVSKFDMKLDGVQLDLVNVETGMKYPGVIVHVEVPDTFGIDLNIEQANFSNVPGGRYRLEVRMPDESMETGRADHRNGPPEDDLHDQQPGAANAGAIVVGLMLQASDVPGGELLLLAGALLTLWILRGRLKSWAASIASSLRAGVNANRHPLAAT